MCIPSKKKKKHEVNVPSCYVSKHTASVAFYLPASKYSDDYGHKHMKSLGLFNAYIQQDIHLGRLLLSDLSFDIIRKSTCLRCKPNFNSHNDLAIWYKYRLVPREMGTWDKSLDYSGGRNNRKWEIFKEGQNRAKSQSKRLLPFLLLCHLKPGRRICLPLQPPCSLMLLVVL